MAETHHLLEPVVILLAAVIAVTLFQRIGLGSVLGYLVAGTVIGPSGLALVTDDATITTLAELGVVFLLFNVGLELPIERIRTMRSLIFGLGGVQVVVTMLVVGAITLLAGGNASTGLAVGGALALSSTAVVLRLLSSRRQIATRFGRSAVAILLMQDLAVGPLLVLVLALGQSAESIAAALALGAVKAAAAVAVILGGGRFLLPRLIRPVAALRDPEPLAAFTLLLVFCAGLATAFGGLSMGFGAFLAGMLLADTPYRHQVAADSQPMLGLLLGLFFVTVGMSIDLARLLREPSAIALLVLGLMVGKTVIIATLARAFAVPMGQALRLGILLSQGGEFGFVLLGAAVAGDLVPAADGERLVVAVALSMMATPLLAKLGAGLSRRVDDATADRPAEDRVSGEPMRDHVVIAGFGRIGGALAQRLLEENQPFIAVDRDAYRVASASARGLPVYYGDATRPEVLEALHVESARAVVVALDDPQMAVRLSSLLHYIFPTLKIYARAYDEAHAEELRAAGADAVISEATAIGISLARLIAEPDEEKIRA